MTYQIINADCLAAMREMPDNSVDLTVTSPPYDNLRDYNGYTFDFEGIAKELYRITKVGGVVVWVVGDATVKGSETGTSFRQALYFKDVCGFNLHDTMIYHKNNFSKPDSTRYWPVFEYMFVFSKGRPKTINLIMDRKNTDAGRKKSTLSNIKREKNGKLTHRHGITVNDYGKRTNIWYILAGHAQSTLDKIASEHPAIFPEALARDHILTWSNEGDLVLDPFMGSGTTLKMAELTGRNSIGIELSAEYCKVAEQRLKTMEESKERELF